MRVRSPGLDICCREVDLPFKGTLRRAVHLFQRPRPPGALHAMGHLSRKNRETVRLSPPRIDPFEQERNIFRDGYYWAIAKDKDATFSLTGYEDRGIKPGAEYRYAVSETTKGQWYGSFMTTRNTTMTEVRDQGQHEQVFGDTTFKADTNVSPTSTTRRTWGLPR